jgi:glutamyl-tRNA reductase
MKDNQFKLSVIGISHKTSSISEREVFQVDKKQIPDSLNYLKSVKGVEGVVIVPTCNRLEFYFALQQGTDPLSIINEFYSNYKIVNTTIKKELFYVYNGTEVAHHLFKVISGLDSLVLGEYQVQGQIKDAYSIACSLKTADKILHKLFHAAFRTGKSIRTNTKVGNGNQSISGVAFKILKEKLNKSDLLTIIGVNQNTKILAKKLYESGYSHLVFVNRTLYKAEEMAEKYFGHSISLDFLEEALLNSKCVISCTGAPAFILTSECVNKIYKRNKLPKIMIDLALPRDIETENLNKNIEVINLEDLKKYLDEEKKDLVLSLPEAGRLIDSELKLFEAWNESQNDKTVNLLEEKIETIRLGLLNESRFQVSENEFGMLDKFSHSLVHRLKSTLTQVLKINQGELSINKED